MGGKTHLQTGMCLRDGILAWFSPQRVTKGGGGRQHEGDTTDYDKLPSLLRQGDSHMHVKAEGKHWEGRGDQKVG